MVAGEPLFEPLFFSDLELLVILVACILRHEREMTYNIECLEMQAARITDPTILKS